MSLAPYPTPTETDETSPNGDLSRLGKMLAYRRPAGSRTEQKFINRFIRPYRPTVDAYGNAYLIVGDDAPKILWSCHTDTVHDRGGKQRIAFNEGSGLIELHRLEQRSTCLGADNTAGVWLLLEMIDAGIPGLYCFFRAEEIGRKGSTWFADNMRETFASCDFAIAFDRRATGSIITHQMMSRCCSATFTEQLARGLNMGHKPDNGGSYTDTASFTKLISECTNVSAGFDNEHTKYESLDVMYLVTLRNALVTMDYTTLTATRDFTSTSYFDCGFGSDDDGSFRNNYFADRYASKRYAKRYDYHANDDEGDDVPWSNRRVSTIESLVKANPEVVASILEQYGYDAETLAREINVTLNN